MAARSDEMEDLTFCAGASRVEDNEVAGMMVVGLSDWC